MEQTGGFPCRDSVGEFEMLERRLEKEKKKKERAEIRKRNLSWKMRKKYER